MKKPLFTIVLSVMLIVFLISLLALSGTDTVAAKSRCPNYRVCLEPNWNTPRPTPTRRAIPTPKPDPTAVPCVGVCRPRIQTNP